MRGALTKLMCLFALGSQASAWNFPGRDFCAEDSKINFFLDRSNTESPLTAFNHLKALPLGKSQQLISYGYTEGTVWLYLSVKKSSDWVKCAMELADPQLNKIDIYESEAGQLSPISQLGSDNPFEARFLRTRHFVFPFKSDKDREFVISLKSHTSMTVPVKVQWRDGFINSAALDYLLLGLFYGMMLFIIFFGLHNFTSFRDKAFLFYFLFALSMLLFYVDCDGIAFQFLWPDNIYWKQRASWILAAISMILGTYYFASILTIRSRLLLFTTYGYMLVCSVWFLALFLLEPEQFNRATVIVSLGTPLLMILLPLAALKYDQVFAPYMLCAGIASAIGLVTYSLSLMGAIQANFLTENAMKLSTLLEFFLITLGQNKKIKTFNRSRLESQLRLANLEKESAVYKAVFETANMVAHDVRRPLDKMQRFIKRTLKLPTDQVTTFLLETSKEINEDINSANAILSDLMHMGTSDKKSKIMLGEIIKKVTNDGAFKLDLKYVGSIHADGVKLQRAFENLVQNAQEAAPQEAKFWIHSSLDGDHIKVTVGNSDSSIHPNDLTKIFDLFFTSGKDNGNGIGLSVVQKVTTELGGRVWAESNGYTSTGDTVDCKYDYDYVEFHMVLPLGGGKL